MLSRRTLLKRMSEISTLSIIGCDPSAGQPAREQAQDQGPLTGGDLAVGRWERGVDMTRQGDLFQPASEWAAGGTALISQPYPPDQIFDESSSCRLSPTPETTKGPCYFQDETGEDLSLGLTGLPMQLCLRVIDHSCQALEGYLVEVWHCDPLGVYSGDVSMSGDSEGFASDFCTGGAAAALESSWYRGQRRSNQSGRVNFKSHFPGWYPGRSVHIHFAISDPMGRTRTVSQLCFSDALADDIYQSHPLYQARGVQDTPLETDGVFSRVDQSTLLCQTERQPDGTLLTYHTIQVDLRG